jgi:hypothetical protein
MPNIASHRTVFLLIFIVAFALRLLNLAATDFSADALLIEDAKSYWVDATSGQGFLNTVKSIFLGQTERVPGYFIFLAAIVGLFGKYFLPVLVIQSALDSLTCLMIMALGRRVFPENYWVFGLLAAVWPNLIIHSGLILTDTLFTFMFTWFLLSFVWLLETQKLKHAMLVGILLGIATLVRPVTQFLIFLSPLLAPFMLIAVKTNVRRAIVNSLAIFLISVACLTPIFIKNSYSFGSIALTSQNGNHLQNWVASEVVMLRDGISRSEAVAQLFEKTDQQMLSLPTEDQNNPFVKSSYQSKTALAEILTSPPSVVIKSWLQGAIINVASPAVMIDTRFRALPHLSFAEGTSGNLVTRIKQFIAGSSTTYVAILLVGISGSLIVSLMQFGGFFVQLRVTPMLASLGFLTVAYFVLINGPAASPKYRLPLEPILIIWLGCALSYCHGLTKKWLYRRAVS